MITLLSGQNDAKTYRGKVFGGINVTFLAVNGTANDPLTQAELLVKNLSFTAQLNRGFEHNICTLNGDHLGAGVFRDNFDFFNPANTGNQGYQLLIEAAPGAFETGLVSVFMPFGSPVDVRSMGEITLSAEASAGIFASTLNQNTSQVTLDLMPVEGIEVGLPQIVAVPIQSSETNPYFSGGDGVRSVVFLNRDKSGITTANQVLTSANVVSDERSYSLNYNQLLAQRNKMFPWVENSNDRGQSFELLPFNGDKVYFGVTINANSNAANVNSAKNYFVCWKSKPSSASVATGRASLQKRINKVQNYYNQSV